MPTQGRPQAGAAARRTGGGSAPLEQLRRGEITLDAYLDFRADESVKHLTKRVPASRLRMLRDTARELLASDPVLLRMLRNITGMDPEGSPAK
jgi:hypothetical protein